MSDTNDQSPVIICSSRWGATLQPPMPPPSAIQGDGSVQQGLSAAYESIAFCKHRRAADKRYSLGCTGGIMARRKNEARERAQRLSECPDRCSGRDRSRQRPLTEGERKILSVSARKVITESSGSPHICGYCGCVYIRESNSNIRLGTLDGMPGPGWHSRNFP